MKINIGPRTFNQQQIAQAEAIKLSDHYQNRLPVFGITIDDASTVDRDDGIWLRELANDQFELQVSITDVSALIPKDSQIDREAAQRVVTLYHTHPPTPMLPCHLSTNIGSLEEEQARLAMTVFFLIDAHGDIQSFEIKETIFTSKRAFNYAEVEKILSAPEDIPEHKLLKKIQKIAQLMGQKRGGKSGIITKDGYVDEDGNLIQENINAHQLIAELMILTNRTIATFLADQGVRAIYRTQDVGSTDFKLVMKTMAHCLVPAQYDSQSKPHVGLALINYLHFTSPLRRFVDLVNHRILKQIIHKKEPIYTELELTNFCDYINIFQQKSKFDKENYLRKKRNQELKEKYGDPTQVKIANLSADELSDLIQYSAQKKTLHKVITPLKSRSEDLQPKDFYYLWFVAEIQDFFEIENLDPVSVLLIKSQLENTVIDYQIEYCQYRQKYFAFCYLNDLTTQHPVEDSKKSRAKKKSALQTIKAYLEQELTTKPQPIPNLFNLPSAADKSNNDLLTLSEKEFSKVLDYALSNGFNEQIMTAITQRIDRLTPKDWYKIWFQGQVNRFWEYSQIDAVSVLLIHSQLTKAIVNYEIKYSAETQQYYAYCCVNNQTHTQPQGESKKNKAKQKASLAYIQSYLQGQLIDVPEELSVPILTISNVVEEELADSSDWVSKLHQLCQTNPQNILNYDFEAVDSLFICSVKFWQENQVFQATGYGKSKKEAKQIASKVCLVQHNLL